MPIPAGPDVDPADLPPEHSLQVDDVRTPALTVVAPDGSPGSTTADPPTAVTATVTGPDTEPADLDPTTPDGGATWVSDAYTCTEPGRWVETWTVTGHGADTWYTVVLVHPAPTAGGQTWIPTREQVAAIIPRRTHVGAADGWGTTQATFTNLTRPSATVVDTVISQAARWVELPSGPIVNPTIEQSATDAAALYAAGLILLQYPDEDGDRDTGKTLLAQAADMRKQIAANNVVDTGTDPTSTVVMPVWYFPPATELQF
jgi:hypothetical protein